MLKFVIDKLNNVSMTGKLLISYVLLVFIPVLVVGLALTGNMRNMALDQSVREAVVNAERLEKSFTDIVKIPTDFSNILYMDKTLEEIVDTQYTSVLGVVQTYRQYTKFDDYLRLYSFISGIMLYSQNDTLIDNWRFMRVTGDVVNSAWYKDAVAGKGLITWRYIYNESKNKYSFSMTRMLGTPGKPVGVLVIDLDDTYLNSILLSEPFETVIVDDSGYVVAAKDKKMFGQTIDKLDIPPDIVNKGQGTYRTQFMGKLSEVVLRSFSPPGSMSRLRILCAFPIDSITAPADRTNRMGLTIIAICLSVSFIFIALLSYLLSKRIRRLSGDVHKVASGDFDFTPAIQGRDEVGTLSGDIGKMAVSIKRLMVEVNEAARQKDLLAIRQKEIKLRMLANQINPHFLFNALESVRMRIISDGDGEAADIVALLGKIMRRTLETNHEWTTLSEEIDMVRSYLNIQKFRYGSKVNYAIQIEQDVADYRIMPFILQPIVENSVIHGLELAKGTGMIKISARREGGAVSISVSDNGLGMSGDRLKTVTESLEDREQESGSGRIGLKNVHQRIRLKFGDGYGLTIQSREGEGTQVILTLPASVQ